MLATPEEKQLLQFHIFHYYHLVYITSFLPYKSWSNPHFQLQASTDDYIRGHNSFSV